MSDEDLVNSSKLNTNDKLLLIDMIKTGRYPKDIHQLSIFSKKGKFVKNGEYNTYIYSDGDYFYNNIINSWFDSDFKLLLFTNWWYKTYSLTNFINHINLFLFLTQNVDLTTYTLLPSGYVTVQKWHITYGHFLDEIFCLYDFIKKTSIIDNPFFSFQLEIENNMYGTSNYKQVCKILFGDNYYNSVETLVKVQNLTLITHEYDENTFHWFPIEHSNFIINRIIRTPYLEKNNALFITRGNAAHLNRNLDNQTEIENYLKEQNVTIFNPEKENFDNLVKIIQEHTKIIITWGSALVNLIFCKPFSEIIILKSKSYQSESINLFNKIINQRQLKIKIITDIDNKIDPELIVF